MAAIRSAENSFPILISIVIVTLNRVEDVLKAVKSVYDQTYRRFEIIVVDNGSNDDTIRRLAEDYPEVEVIGLNENIGASAGRNTGIRSAKGEIIFCLDSDAFLERNALEAIVCRFRRHPEVGIINSRILDPETGDVGTGPGWVYSEKQKAYQDVVFPSWSFSEGGVAIRRGVFDSVGLFWERLSFGCEGQDLGLRAWDAGFTIIYDPDSVVYHKASPLSRIDGATRDRQFLENTLSIYLARYPWWMILLVAPLKTGAVLLRGLRRGYLWTVLAALKSTATNLPGLLRERAPVCRRTALNYLRLLREQGPLSWDLASWIRHKA